MTATIQFQPYIFFYGRCEEALEFYKNALGGTYELQRIKDMPASVASQMPATPGERVMHAKFEGAGVRFFASDGRDTKAIDPDAGNISLSLDANDAAQGDRLFKALSEGGEVRMPLADAFWGGRFGVTVDRFGIEWMISTP
jgi:PhnB protein